MLFFFFFFFFQISNLGNIFEKFTKKCQKMQKKSDFFWQKTHTFDFFGQNFQKYCLIQKIEKKKPFLELCLNMIFKQF